MTTYSTCFFIDPIGNSEQKGVIVVSKVLIMDIER